MYGTPEYFEFVLLILLLGSVEDNAPTDET